MAAHTHPHTLPNRRCKMMRLQKRSDFLRVAARKINWATRGLVLQVAPHQTSTDQAERSALTLAMCVGFTASKRVGRAVQRNRAKRRLRAVADHVLPVEAMPQMDYVLIGRRETLERSYDALVGDLRYALKKLNIRAIKNVSHRSQEIP